MRSAGTISLGTAALCLGLVTALAAQQPSSAKAAESRPAQSPATSKPAVATATPAVSHPQAASAAASTAADYNGLVKKYCVGCHNDRNKDRVGSLTLASFDFAKAGERADISE